ncbi:MAG TPA: creatininase family protein [Chloroflexota bacterium]
MVAKTLLGEMTREQVRLAAPETTLVIPVAAIEQHGPDLPVMVDVIACETVAHRAAVTAGQTVPVTVAPMVPYGYSPHHFPYAGVFSLQAETLLAVLRELGDSAVRSGFRRIFFLNGHGGNDELVRLAAREVSNSHACLAGAASYWSLAMPALRKLASVEGWRVPGHAGDFEASLIHAVRPDLVDTVHPAPAKGTPLGPVPDTTVAMFMQRDHSMQRIDGYTDRSAQASREIGQMLLDVVQVEVAKELVRFHQALPPDA